MLEEFMVKDNPFYLPQGNEVQIFEAAYDLKQAVMLKGPTGCGKTRFIEYMFHKLQLPLVTSVCNEDTDSADLTGRYILKGAKAEWIDGSLTLPVRHGGGAYLDEIIEARQDVMVLIHSLTDTRRMLPIPKTGETLYAPDNFMLAISFNPGYQSVNKDLKQSTRQRFISIDFGYPSQDIETEIITHESQVDETTAEKLVNLGFQIRNIKSHGLAEGASTRLLIYAGQLMKKGISPREACQVALRNPITDNKDIIETIDMHISNYFK